MGFSYFSACTNIQSSSLLTYPETLEVLLLVRALICIYEQQILWLVCAFAQARRHDNTYRIHLQMYILCAGPEIIKINHGQLN